MTGGYVAITDNADPMNVVVYRTAKQLRTGSTRVVCEVPVFDKGASATENSLIAAGRSLFVENNYGYQDPFGPNAGALTEPGFARVDVNARRQRLPQGVGEHDRARARRVVPKLSTKTGLIYTYTPRRRTRRHAALVLDGDRRRAPARPASSATRAPAWPSTTTTPASRSARDGTAYLGVIGGIVSAARRVRRAAF